MIKGRKIKREENKMMKRIHIVMLCAVLGTTVVLFTANQAGAGCDPTAKAAYECGESVFAGTTDPSGWTVEIVKEGDGEFPSTVQCVDKRGNSFECLQFKYKITAPEGASLSQVNMKIPNSPCDITLDSWQDSSVKIREFEPSTGFGAEDFFEVITWDALKLDPDNQASIAVYTSLAGADRTTMELKSEELHWVTILGPTCCSATQTSNIKTFETSCEVNNIAVEAKVVYDECTDVAEGASWVTKDSSDNIVEQGTFEPILGSFLCLSDNAGSYDKRTCELIDTWGPEDGVIFATTHNLYFGYAGDLYPPFQTSAQTRHPRL
jgi:hypothetical protein